MSSTNQDIYGPPGGGLLQLFQRTRRLQEARQKTSVPTTRDDRKLGAPLAEVTSTTRNEANKSLSTDLSQAIKSGDRWSNVHPQPSLSDAGAGAKTNESHHHKDVENVQPESSSQQRIVWNDADAIEDRIQQKRLKEAHEDPMRPLPDVDFSIQMEELDKRFQEQLEVQRGLNSALEEVEQVERGIEWARFAERVDERDATIRSHWAAAEKERVVQAQMQREHDARATAEELTAKSRKKVAATSTSTPKTSNTSPSSVKSKIQIIREYDDKPEPYFKQLPRPVPTDIGSASPNLVRNSAGSGTQASTENVSKVVGGELPGTPRRSTTFSSQVSVSYDSRHPPAEEGEAQEEDSVRVDLEIEEEEGAGVLRSESGVIVSEGGSSYRVAREGSSTQRPTSSVDSWTPSTENSGSRDGRRPGGGGGDDSIETSSSQRRYRDDFTPSTSSYDSRRDGIDDSRSYYSYDSYSSSYTDDSRRGGRHRGGVRGGRELHALVKQLQYVCNVAAKNLTAASELTNANYGDQKRRRSSLTSEDSAEEARNKKLRHIASKTGRQLERGGTHEDPSGVSTEQEMEQLRQLLLFLRDDVKDLEKTRLKKEKLSRMAKRAGGLLKARHMVKHGRSLKDALGEMEESFGGGGVMVIDSDDEKGRKRRRGGGDDISEDFEGDYSFAASGRAGGDSDDIIDDFDDEMFGSEGDGFGDEIDDDFDDGEVFDEDDDEYGGGQISEDGMEGYSVDDSFTAAGGLVGQSSMLNQDSTIPDFRIDDGGSQASFAGAAGEHQSALHVVKRLAGNIVGAMKTDNFSPASVRTDSDGYSPMLSARRRRLLSAGDYSDDETTDSRITGSGLKPSRRAYQRQEESRRDSIPHHGSKPVTSTHHCAPAYSDGTITTDSWRSDDSRRGSHRGRSGSNASSSIRGEGRRKNRRVQYSSSSSRSSNSSYDSRKPNEGARRYSSQSTIRTDSSFARSSDSARLVKKGDHRGHGGKAGLSTTTTGGAKEHAELHRPAIQYDDDVDDEFEKSTSSSGRPGGLNSDFAGSESVDPASTVESSSTASSNTQEYSAQDHEREDRLLPGPKPFSAEFAEQAKLNRKIAHKQRKMMRNIALPSFKKFYDPYGSELSGSGYSDAERAAREGMGNEPLPGGDFIFHRLISQGETALLPNEKQHEDKKSALAAVSADVSPDQSSATTSSVSSARSGGSVTDDPSPRSSTPKTTKQETAVQSAKGNEAGREAHAPNCHSTTTTAVSEWKLLNTEALTSAALQNPATVSDDLAHMRSQAAANLMEAQAKIEEVRQAYGDGDRATAVVFLGTDPLGDDKSEMLARLGGAGNANITATTTDPTEQRDNSSLLLKGKMHEEDTRRTYDPYEVAESIALMASSYEELQRQSLAESSKVSSARAEAESHALATLSVRRSSSSALRSHQAKKLHASERHDDVDLSGIGGSSARSISLRPVHHHSSSVVSSQPGSPMNSARQRNSRAPSVSLGSPLHRQLSSTAAAAGGGSAMSARSNASSGASIARSREGSMQAAPVVFEAPPSAPLMQRDTEEPQPLKKRKKSRLTKRFAGSSDDDESSSTSSNVSDDDGSASSLDLRANGNATSSSSSATSRRERNQQTEESRTRPQQPSGGAVPPLSIPSPHSTDLSAVPNTSSVFEQHHRQQGVSSPGRVERRVSIKEASPVTSARFPPTIRGQTSHVDTTSAAIDPLEEEFMLREIQQLRAQEEAAAGEQRAVWAKLESLSDRFGEEGSSYKQYVDLKHENEARREKMRRKSRRAKERSLGSLASGSDVVGRSEESSSSSCRTHPSRSSRSSWVDEANTRVNDVLGTSPSSSNYSVGDASSPVGARHDEHHHSSSPPTTTHESSSTKKRGQVSSRDETPSSSLRVLGDPVSSSSSAALPNLSSTFRAEEEEKQRRRENRGEEAENVLDSLVTKYSTSSGSSPLEDGEKLAQELLSPEPEDTLDSDGF